MSRRCCCCPFPYDTGGNAPETRTARITFSGISPSYGQVQWEDLNGNTYDIPYFSKVGYPSCEWNWHYTNLSDDPYSITTNFDGGFPLFQIPCNTTKTGTTHVLHIVLLVVSPSTMYIGVTATTSNLQSSSQVVWTSTDGGATWAAGVFCDGSSTGAPTITVAFV